MNINEDKFNRETTLLQIAWKTKLSTVCLAELNSEPIRTHFILGDPGATSRDDVIFRTM